MPFISNRLPQSNGLYSDTARVLWQRFGLQFVAVTLNDGTVIAELPDLQLTHLTYRFEETTSETATLPWRNAPRNWDEATTPYQVAILLLRESTVLWGGIVVKRERAMRGEGLTLTLATVEHYLDNVYVQDHTYTNRDQCEIVENLVTTTLKNHRFNLVVEASPSSVKRDRTYEAESDKTLLSVLQELASVLNGPEWCTSWRAINDGHYEPVMTVADHIGSTTPSTTFDESVMTKFNMLEDYTNGYGANAVMAVSTADAGDRPQSDWMIANQPNRPMLEYVFQPSTSITNKSTLNEHAKSSLLQMQNGTQTITMGLSLLSAPMVYEEWKPGDLISWTVKEDAEHFPDHNRGKARIIGYEIDFSQAWTITPILQQEDTNAEQIQVQSR